MTDDELIASIASDAKTAGYGIPPNPKDWAEMVKSSTVLTAAFTERSLRLRDMERAFEMAAESHGITNVGLLDEKATPIPTLYEAPEWGARFADESTIYHAYFDKDMRLMLIQDEGSKTIWADWDSWSRRRCEAKFPGPSPLWDVPELFGHTIKVGKLPAEYVGNRYDIIDLDD